MGKRRGGNGRHWIRRMTIDAPIVREVFRKALCSLPPTASTAAEPALVR